MRNISWGLSLCAGVAGIIAALCSGAIAADQVRVGKAQAIAWSFVPLDLGVKEGIFAKYGIDIQEVDLAGDAKVQQALAADSVDIGLGSGPGLAFIAKGSPAIGVAAFAGPPRNISLTVLEDSPIKTLADMKGKLVSVSTVGSLSDWLTMQMSIAEGWGPKGIKTVPLGAIDASIAALRAHQLDAVILATEAGFRLEEAHEGRILVSMDTFAPHFITHVVYARRQFLADHPDEVNRFLKGFFASIGFLKSHEALTSEVAQSVVHVSPGVAALIYDYEVSMLTVDGTFDPQAVTVLKQSFVDMGTLNAIPKDDDLFTTRFLPVRP